MTPSPSDCRTCSGLGFLAGTSSEWLCPTCRGRGTGERPAAPAPILPLLGARVGVRLIGGRRVAAAGEGVEA